MILNKDQINRYMRHIIMPEISGQGQKRINESAILIYSETVKDALPLVLYLAASGIGHIFCDFDDKDYYESLFFSAKDLNGDISIELINKKSPHEVENSEKVCRIILGSLGFVSKIMNNAVYYENENVFIPSIIAVPNQWRGLLQTFDIYDAYKEFALTMSESKFPERTAEGTVSKSFLGTLCAIEVIKLVLRIGELNKNSLYFDLLHMEFVEAEAVETGLFLDRTAECKDNDWSKTRGKINNLKVLIVGAGGLGSPVALALSMVGIGTIGLVDYDTVEISNLNRQILHSTSRIGQSKVKSAEVFLKSINPQIDIVLHKDRLSRDNAKDIIRNYDIVVDGLDNFPTRYLLNDACFFMNKPMIEAGVLRFSGLSTTIIPREGHCYRCLMPEMPQQGSGQSCEESGILGPVPGVMGSIQAAEAIKIAAGIGTTLRDRILYFDALNTKFTLIDLDKNSYCPLCGDKPIIDSLQEYDQSCDSMS
ncbi:ThiF family adenylyltransferase [Gudongella sp. DL1XJH-153]|uniref:ThiF family adenylyltransferase n=1 Tax=Gudongella sp. DL1XJH-153 TaxID=3409804 RepID=UPI003BB53E09